MVEHDRTNLWKSIIRALEAEPREAKVIRGLSGLEHRALAVGVDDQRGRLVLISADHDGRSAAMMQADVQATFDPSVKVLVARPVLINLPSIAQKLIERIGSPSIVLEQFQEITTDTSTLDQFLKPSIEPMARAFRAASPQILSQVFQVVQQLALLDFNVASTPTDVGDEKSAFESLGLGKLAETDVTQADRELGVCGLPLYQLSENQTEALSSGRDIEQVADILGSLGVYQYFFPPPDQAALGLVDRGLRDADAIGRKVIRAPELGHPLSTPELVAVDTHMFEMVESLCDRGYLVSGEFGLEASERGKSVRTEIRFQPREGLISKLINRFDIKLNLKDLFGGSE